MAFLSASWLSLAVVTSFIAYHVYLVIYRLFFHPLAKFPGPKLAAATDLYEVYFNVIKRGMFLWEIESMHKQYGKPKPLFNGDSQRSSRSSTAIASRAEIGFSNQFSC